MKIKEITLRETYTISKIDPAAGAELIDKSNPDGVKMIVPVDQLAAMQADPQNPNKFTMNQNAVAPTADQQGQQPQGPQPGSEVEFGQPDLAATETFDNTDLIGSGENNDVGGPNGGDKTDDLIYDVTPEERNMRGNMRESAELNAMLVIAGLR